MIIISMHESIGEIIESNECKIESNELIRVDELVRVKLMRLIGRSVVSTPGLEFQLDNERNG